MKKFIAKRLAQMLVVFVAVSMFAFSIIYFSPGDPLYLYTSPAVSSYKMSDEQLDAMRESLGLNGNVAERYVSWAGKMLQGDWGLSVSNHQRLRNRLWINFRIQSDLWEQRWYCQSCYLYHLDF